MLNKDIQKLVEFMIENKPSIDVSPSMNGLIGSDSATGGKPIQFVLNPESLQNVKDVNTTQSDLISLINLVLIENSYSKISSKRCD